MRLSDTTLKGRVVISSDGRAIGEVAQLFIDGSSWQIESLHVRLRKDVADELGASRSLLRSGTAEIPTRLVQSVGDAILLSVPIVALRDVAIPVPEGGSEGSGEPSPQI